MAKFNEQYDELLESFKFIKTVKREFYPKNFKLSEEFVKAFKSEYTRLIKEDNNFLVLMNTFSNKYLNYNLQKNEKKYD